MKSAINIEAARRTTNVVKSIFAALLAAFPMTSFIYSEAEAAPQMINSFEEQPSLDVSNAPLETEIQLDILALVAEPSEIPCGEKREVDIPFWFHWNEHRCGSCRDDYSPGLSTADTLRLKAYVETLLSLLQRNTTCTSTCSQTKTQCFSRGRSEVSVYPHSDSITRTPTCACTYGCIYESSRRYEAKLTIECGC